MKKTLFEEFELVASHRFRKEKMEELQRLRKENEHIVAFLKMTYLSNRYQWLVDPDMSFKKCNDSESTMYHRLRSEIKKLNRFVSPGPYENLPEKKRNDLFQTVLETIHPQDAELLQFVIKHRKLPFDNLRLDMIAEAFSRDDFSNE